MLTNLFGSSCTLELTIPLEHGRKTGILGRDKKGERAPIYEDGEKVCGSASIIVKPGKKIDHQGVKVEFIGQVDMLYDKSNSYDFFSITKDVSVPGSVFETQAWHWEFSNADKKYETYWGINVRLRYFIRLTVIRPYASNVVKETDILVQNKGIPPEINNSIKMEVGIEDCLHIEFEYEKSKLHLKDVVVGKVYFVLVRLKIKHMELDIIRREITGQGVSPMSDSETISKFEIMDGAPIRSECVPVRLYLSGFDLTPTYRSCLNKFSVRYYLNLVLVDEEDRRYFKQQEIFLWRKKIG
eukprot:GHVR01134947.1.p1 GENE.GHVR01134947.1~~GHVR01134947.1.p1  ORF type:complete len:308 (-),score=44.90 GHVR01134947.1:38-931(-)